MNRFPESFNHDPPTNGGLDCGRFTTSCGSRKRSGGGNCKYANGYEAPCTVDDVFLAGNSFVRGRDFSARLWTFDIGNAPAVTANAGVKVTQGTSTGILKTALSGGITTIVVQAATGVSFNTLANLEIGDPEFRGIIIQVEAEDINEAKMEGTLAPGDKVIEVNGIEYFWYVEYKCVDSKGGGVRSSSDADANTLLDSDNDGVPDYIDSDSDGDEIYDFIEAFKCAYNDKKKTTGDQLRFYTSNRGIAEAGDPLSNVVCSGTCGTGNDNDYLVKVPRPSLPEHCYALALSDSRCFRGGLTEITFGGAMTTSGLGGNGFECYCPVEGPQYLHKEGAPSDWCGGSGCGQNGGTRANFLCEGGTDGAPLDSGKKNI